MKPDCPPALVPHGKNAPLHAFGDEVTLLLTGAETGGRYTMFIDSTPPGGGPPPHYHRREDEWFFVLEGEMEFLVEGAWREAPAGSAVFAPKESVHTFRNKGTKSSRMLVQTAPAGIENFFISSAEEFKKPGGAEHGKAGSDRRRSWDLFRNLTCS